ncbi:MAG: dephospho-CoA kinase [Acidobacteria bacterium]|nr:dephospho-CoA kinase [Acidobacteriota bacterium]
MSQPVTSGLSGGLTGGLTGGFTVGLTGGIASGKSTVAGWLAESGFTVIDADDVVGRLYQSGQAGSDVVRALFGAATLDPTGAVDHARLAERVFSDSQALESLEERIHPLVRAQFAEAARRSEAPAVLEATLLVEAGYAPDFDLVVTVEAEAERRIERAVARGLSEAEARARFEAQADRGLRARAAHRVLQNDGSLEDLREQVDALIDWIRQIRQIRALETRQET